MAYSVFLVSIPVEMQLPVAISTLFEVFYIQILRKDIKHYPFIGQNQDIILYHKQQTLVDPYSLYLSGLRRFRLVRLQCWTPAMVLVGR